MIVAMKLAYPVAPHMDYARPLPVVSLKQDAHASLSEVQRYTKAADQKRLALSAMEKAK